MTSSWLAVRFLGHDPAAAVLLAAMSGLLALVIALLASPEVQKTARTWIRHRAEVRIAAAEAFDIRRRSRARTCGRRWSRAGAEQIRKAAAAPDQSRASLAEIMRITRNRDETARKLRLLSGSPNQQRGRHPSATSAEYQKWTICAQMTMLATRLPTARNRRSASLLRRGLTRFTLGDGSSAGMPRAAALAVRARLSPSERLLNVLLASVTVSREAPIRQAAFLRCRAALQELAARGFPGRRLS